MPAGDNVEPVRRYLDRLINLANEKQAAADGMKDIFVEVKSAGLDPKAMRILLKEEMESAEKKKKREEVQENVEMMRAALQRYAGLPLVDHALERTY